MSFIAGMFLTYCNDYDAYVSFTNFIHNHYFFDLFRGNVSDVINTMKWPLYIDQAKNRQVQQVLQASFTWALQSLWDPWHHNRSLLNRLAPNPLCTTSWRFGPSLPHLGQLYAWWRSLRPQSRSCYPNCIGKPPPKSKLLHNHKLSEGRNQHLKWR
jgi:hypothetical protein